MTRYKMISKTMLDVYDKNTDPIFHYKEWIYSLHPFLAIIVWDIINENVSQRTIDLACNVVELGISNSNYVMYLANFNSELELDSTDINFLVKNVDICGKNYYRSKRLQNE